jgi:transcriptional regulator with XRE-family HTH domain
LTTGYVQITTRANLQVRLIAPKDTPEFLRRVQSVGLHTRGAGADNIRNLTANPTSGVDPVELIDVMPFVHELAQVIINERAFYDLPRKFNIAFDGGGLIGSVEDTNDIGVKAVKVGEKLAELMRAWRNRCKLSRVQAAHALRSTGLRTMARTVWTWETARALPQRPMAVLDLIHGPLAVNPPKPKAAIMEPRQFAALLSRWRRGLRMTQAQASAELGLPPDQSLICDYERGNAFPRPERIRAILDAIASRPAPPPPPRIRPSPFARGLTLARAAAILGCPVATLCKYEHGRSEPPAHRRAPILAIID